MGEDTEASIKLSGQLELLRKDIASRIEVMDIKVVNKLSSIDTHLGRLNSSVEKNHSFVDISIIARPPPCLIAYVPIR